MIGGDQPTIHRAPARNHSQDSRNLNEKSGNPSLAGHKGELFQSGLSLFSAKRAKRLMASQLQARECMFPIFRKKCRRNHLACSLFDIQTLSRFAVENAEQH